MKKTTVVSLALLAAVSLSGCGSDNDDNPSSNANASGLSGEFVGTVKSVIAQSPDNTEPSSIDNVTATADDAGEPEAI